MSGVDTSAEAVERVIETMDHAGWTTDVMLIRALLAERDSLRKELEQYRPAISTSAMSASIATQIEAGSDGPEWNR